jgi:hypothetical protein
VREKSQYREKQEAAQNRRDEAEKRQRDIEKSDTFERIVEEQRATREQQDRHEQAKRDRDNRTIFGIWATALAALITVIVAHIDTRGVIDEAHQSAAKQHTDTLAALAKTDAAIAETRRLADAARDQANVAKDTEQRQLRAYVFPNVSIENVNGDVSKIETDVPKMVMIMKNTGLTPAYEVSVMGVAALGKFPIALRIRYERLERGASPTLAAGVIDPMPIRIENVSGPLSKEQKLALSNGSAAIYVIGEILYRDIFSMLWCTKFAYYVGGDVGFYGVGMADASEGKETDKNCHEPVRGEPPRFMVFPPKPNPH